MSISGIGPRMGLYPQGLKTPQNKLHTQKAAATTQPLPQWNPSPAPQQAPSGVQMIQQILKSFLESLGQRRTAPSNTDNTLLTYAQPDIKTPAFGANGQTDLSAQQFALPKLPPVTQSHSSTAINPFLQAKFH